MRTAICFFPVGVTARQLLLLLPLPPCTSIRTVVASVHHETVRGRAGKGVSFGRPHLHEQRFPLLHEHSPVLLHIVQCFPPMHPQSNWQQFPLPARKIA